MVEVVLDVCVKQSKAQMFMSWISRNVVQNSFQIQLCFRLQSDNLFQINSGAKV